MNRTARMDVGEKVIDQLHGGIVKKEDCIEVVVVYEYCFQLNHQRQIFNPRQNVTHQHNSRSNHTCTYMYMF